MNKCYSYPSPEMEVGDILKVDYAPIRLLASKYLKKDGVLLIFRDSKKGNLTSYLITSHWTTGEFQELDNLCHEVGLEFSASYDFQSQSVKPVKIFPQGSSKTIALLGKTNGLYSAIATDGTDIHWCHPNLSLLLNRITHHHYQPS